MHKTDSLNIMAEFECGNASNITRSGENCFTLFGRPDYAENISNEYVNSDYYVSFRVINNSNEDREITVDINCPNLPFCSKGRTIATRILDSFDKYSYKDWQVLDGNKFGIVQNSGMDDSFNTLRVNLKATSGKILDVSTMYWMSYSEVEKTLNNMENKGFNGAKIENIGKSASGRIMKAVIFQHSGSRKRRKLAIIAATPQSNELGTIAVMGIIEELLCGNAADLLADYDLAFIPVSNPDGNIMGTCMTNSLNQNIIFGFEKAGTGMAPKECEAVWEFVVKRNPSFFIEFHSYPHLDRPSYRPYRFDENLFTNNDTQKKGKLFFDALQTASPHDPFYLEKDSLVEVHFRPSIVSRLIREYGIPSTIYKLHSRETVQDNINQAINVLRKVIYVNE